MTQLIALARLWPLWAALAAALSLGLNVSKAHEEGRLRAVIAGHEACAVAVAGEDTIQSALVCGEPFRARHHQAVRTEACDTALGAGDAFGVETGCSTEVKTVVAQRNANALTIGSLVETLTRERADQAGAITRAETRARTQTERNARAAASIAAAPRDGDLLVLDAERLRGLRGEDAGPVAR